MPGHDIIVIGGSAGGVQALRMLIGQLSTDLPAAIFVVLHVPPDRPSLLPTLLNHAGSMLALHPADGTPIRNGCIYIAPPDHHILIEGPLVRVVHGPRENRCRPAIDPLFRSAAAGYGERVIGIVLSGTMEDGSAGLLAVRRHGGITVVQDPAEAIHDEMPRNALLSVPVDHCVGIVEMARRLEVLVREPASEPLRLHDSMMNRELDSMAVNVREMERDERPGTSSPYSCPDCGGVLWEIDDEGLLRFRCRVGHAFTTGTMLAEQAEATERALWMALKTLEERASMLRRMLRGATGRGNPNMTSRFAEELRTAEESATVLRSVLLRSASLTVPRSN